MRTPGKLAPALIAVIIAAPAPALALGATGADDEDWVPYTDAPQESAPAPAPDQPPADAESAPPADAEAAAPDGPSAPSDPELDADQPADSEGGGGVPAPLAGAAQYATACGVPCALGWVGMVPFLGQALVLAIPALNGWLVQMVGDALLKRETSPVAPIVGAYIGQLCVMPACTVTGVGVFLAAYLGGAAAFLTGSASGNTNPLTLGFWLGLSAVGYVVLLSAVLCGQASSAALPVAAYHLFSGEEEPEVDERAEEEVLSTSAEPGLPALRADLARRAARMAY